MKATVKTKKLDPRSKLPNHIKGYQRETNEAAASARLYARKTKPAVVAEFPIEIMYSTRNTSIVKRTIRYDAFAHENFAIESP